MVFQKNIKNFYDKVYDINRGCGNLISKSETSCDFLYYKREHSNCYYLHSNFYSDYMKMLKDQSAKATLELWNIAIEDPLYFIHKKLYYEYNNRKHVIL